METKILDDIFVSAYDCSRMADPNMTSVNIPKPLHRKLKLLRKKTRLAVGVMAELAIEEYIRKSAIAGRSTA